MKRDQLTLELLEDAVLSARSATLGGHRSLDYIPGAVLYGVCASRLYGSLGKNAFLVFHCDKVRFGNGYPVAANGTTGYPIPFSWHKIKGETFTKDDDRLIDGEKIFSGKTEDGKQLKQLRDGYVTPEGLYLEPKTTFRMKTAINPVDGTAAEAQLFGYEAIEAGQKFHASLDFDDDISEDLIKQIRESLDGTIYIGRSRSAQYGKVKCSVEQVEVRAAPSHSGGTLSLFLVSDLCLEDENGMPALWPSPTLFGLKTGRFDAENSFLRFRYYSPYNMARRHYDNERHVIQQGSVVTFQDISSTEDLSHLIEGLGNYRCNGLGQVFIQPEWVLKPGSDIFPDAELSSPPKPPEEPQEPLVAWLKSRVKTGSARKTDRRLAEEMNRELEKIYVSARKYAGEPAGTLVGPGKTQWGLVLDAGKRFANDKEKLLKELEKICGSSDQAWSCETGVHQNPTFEKWLLNFFKGVGTNPGRVIANLARLAMDTAEMQTKPTRTQQEEVTT